jgi:hypothetical protein
MTIQSKIKGFRRAIIHRLNPSKEKEKFISNVSALLSKHMENLKTLHVDLELKDTSGISFGDLLNAIHLLLHQMRDMIHTMSEQPKESVTDYFSKIIVGYSYSNSEEAAQVRKAAVDTLFDVGRELSTDYYQWWDDAVSLKLIGIDEQRPKVPNFFSDVLQACYDKCGDATNVSLLCEICRNTDAGKLLGSLTLVNSNHQASTYEETLNQYALRITEMQYNVILSTIREIIINVGYYSGLQPPIQKKYDKLLSDMDTKTSIYSDCAECKQPYTCSGGSLESVCKNATVLNAIFADQKKKEVFYVGYKVLTTPSALLSLANRVSTFFISSQSILDTLIRLANVVIDGTPITWEVISDVYKFLSTMKGSRLVAHAKLVSKLNEAIRAYGISLDI